MKWFLGLSVLCALLIAASLTGSAFGSIAQSGTPDASPDASPNASPVASPVASPEATEADDSAIADLEAVVFDLQATVSAQSDEISALQTQVADLASTPDSPTSTAVPEEQDLTVVILLRARADEIEGEDLGEACSGAGRFDDLDEDTAVTISDENGEVLSTGTLESSEIVFAGSLFRECQLTHVLPDVPAVDHYVLAIGDRAELTLSHDELDAVDWVVKASYGP